MNENFLKSVIVKSSNGITGFNYAYCRLLTNKLIHLIEDDNFYVEGNESMRKSSASSGNSMTLIGETVWGTLKQQVKTEYSSSYNSPKMVDEMIKTLNEFLAIFEEEEKPVF